MNKTLEEKIKQGRQYRSMTMEVRQGEVADKESYIVEGYASTFEDAYTLYEDDSFRYDEIVDARSFDDCDLSDVIMQYDHQGKVYARGSNGTLEVTPDEHGLKIRAYLGGTEDGRKLYEEIKGGYTNKMSFGFIVAEDEETRSTDNESGKDIYTRRILKMQKCFDVSAVSLPANDGTSISVRSLIDGVIDRRTQELRELENQKAEYEKRIADEQKKEKARQERDRLALELELSLSLKK